MTFVASHLTDRDHDTHPRQGDERFRSAVASIKDYVIVLMSPDGIVLTWNEGGYRITGYTDSEIIGQSFERFYTPEARGDGHPGRLLATARAAGRVEDEGWRVRKDGTRFWAHVVITVRRDDRDQIAGFAAVLRDVTERGQEAQTFLLRAGQELADSLDYETTLQRVVQQAVPSLADACFVDLRVGESRLRPYAMAHVDAGMEAWLRSRFHLMEDSPATSLRVLRTGQPLIFQAMSEHRMRIVADEERVELDPEVIEAVRALRPTSGISVPLTARGQTLGVLSLVRIDRSPPFGPQDLPLIEQLAHQCALALDNARLYRQANEAVRLRDEFLAVTSHELRRPLSEIKGFASSLLRADVRWDEPTGQDFLREIDREADRLDMLINDLLDMSTLASGASQRFDRAPTPPAVLVSDGLDRVSGALSHRIIDVDPELGGLPAVWVDAPRIQQVIANLVENATKYAPGSAIHISGWVLNAGREVELCVDDDGPGIPDDDLSRIFDKFYRGRSAQQSEVPGTGLGLAIAQAIVEAHDGQIRAENRPGGGARFAFTLPVSTIGLPKAGG